MTEKITVIIPTYKEPEYLDICLDSLYKTQSIEHDVVVVVDGFYDLNKWVIDKHGEKPNLRFFAFKENKGLAAALNYGVQKAQTDKVLIMNDDNVFPDDWDVNLLKHFEEKREDPYFIVANQIEPIMFAQLFAHLYVLKDFGLTHDKFDFEGFRKFEKTIREDKETNEGWTFPFAIRKDDFMKVGGWDVTYDSPHHVDLDFFYKLHLCGLKSYRIFDVHFYHFSGKATINVDGPQKKVVHDHFRHKEGLSGRYFVNKWGFYPGRQPDNSIIPPKK